MWTVTPTEKLVLNVDKMLSISNHLTVGGLNAVLDEDTTAPICATSHNLSMNSASIAQAF